MINPLFLNPERYEERTYWTLKDILVNLGNDTEYSDYYYNGINLADAIVEIFNRNENIEENPMIEEVTEDDQTFFVVRDIYFPLLHLLVKRYLTKYCYYTLEKTFDADKALEFVYRIVSLVNMTAPRYLTLLESYQEAQEDLLSPVTIHSGGITRFNDTPQDSGDFADDSHTTNLTEDSRDTSNDMDTKMGRLKEIESSYRNVLLDWSNEFESLFIEEENI